MSGLLWVRIRVRGIDLMGPLSYIVSDTAPFQPPWNRSTEV